MKQSIKKHLLLSISVLFNSLFILAQQFTLPVFPDTQKSMIANRGVFFSQVEWVAAKADSMNVPIVLHVGDVVEKNDFDQWELASAGMRILDRANIPYAIAVGNHDTGIMKHTNKNKAAGFEYINIRNTQLFNHYFPVNRFSLQKGRLDPEKSDNAYYIFEAGGVKWIVIALEFLAREEAAQWMDKILEEHPDHNAIILTHFHLNDKGEISQGNAYGDMSAIDIFEQYIKPHKNVLMILSGHLCYSAWKVDKGTHGNDIYQILQDYQCNEKGFIRLLDIDTEKRTIHAKMYSPNTGQTLDDSSAFTFSNVEFIR